MIKSHILGCGLATISMIAFAASTEAGSASGNSSIKDAIGKLDHKNDADWTAGGLPSMDRMKELTGDNTLTRAQVAEAHPGFERKSDAPAAQKAGEADQPKGGETGGVSKDAGKFHVPGDAPIEDQGLGNPNDAMNNAERRDPNADASGGVEGKIDDPEYHSQDVKADAGAIAGAYGDPIMLMEAAMLAAGSGRYARNSALQTLLRGYQTAQREIKETQGRLDARQERREDERSERKPARA